MDNLDFKSEFVSDEDVEEMLASLENLFAECVENEDDKASIVNSDKIRVVLYTYKVLKYLTKGTEAKVSVKLNEPFVSMGSVSVVAKDLKFTKPEWLIAAVRLASNFNVYPKTNGTVQMDFTFHGLATTFEE